MRLSATVLELMSFATAVSALPTTSVNKMVNNVAPVTKRDGAEADGALYPVTWIKRDDAETGGTLYPVTWIKRDDAEADGALYPVTWIKRDDAEADGALYPVTWIKEKRELTE